MKFANDENTIAQLKERIAKTIEYLKSIKQNEIDGTENKAISITFPSGQTRQFTGQGLLLGHSLPNFYFHATTAYDIIRQCGGRSESAILWAHRPRESKKHDARRLDPLFKETQPSPDGRKSMHYKAKSISALHIALGGLPGHMRIEKEPGVAVSAKTVDELRKVTSWPENLVITTPQEHYAESVVKVSKVSVATHYPPRR